jgi:hypothetical protein
MPQFDLLITFPLVKDVLVVLTLYYIVFTSVTVINLKALKFRRKASKFFSFKLNTIFVFKSHF